MLLSDRTLFCQNIIMTEQYDSILRHSVRMLLCFCLLNVPVRGVIHTTQLTEDWISKLGTWLNIPW